MHSAVRDSKHRPAMASAPARVLLAGLLGLIAVGASAATDLRTALANLGKPAAAAMSTQTAAVPSAVEVADTLFANGFDNSGGQCLTAVDCPDGAECNVAACTDGICGTAFQSPGVPCSTGKCNGSGLCVQCLTSAECPPAGDPFCSMPLCGGGVCSAIFLPPGAPCPAGTCNGGGLCIPMPPGP